MNIQDIEQMKNHLKVVVLIETYPLTDRFEQIALNEFQYLGIINAIKDFADKSLTGKGFSLLTNNNVSVTLPNVKEVDEL